MPVYFRVCSFWSKVCLPSSADTSLCWRTSSIYALSSSNFKTVLSVMQQHQLVESDMTGGSVVCDAHPQTYAEYLVRFSAALDLGITPQPQFLLRRAPDLHRPSSYLGQLVTSLRCLLPVELSMSPCIWRCCELQLKHSRLPRYASLQLKSSLLPR